MYGKKQVNTTKYIYHTYIYTHSFVLKVNEPVTQGLCALHYAVWQQHYDAVRLLLVRGANINSVDDCGYSAIHLAAEHGYIEMAKLLIESGAKVDFCGSTDELYPKTTLCDEPLRLAVKNKHYVCIYKSF